MPTRPLALGRSRVLGRSGGASPAGGEPRAFELPAHHLVTHGVVVGMTGSGKTGLCMVMVEEALRSRVPVLMVDIKGDLPNLLLLFGSLGAAEFEPWVDADAAARDGKTPGEVAGALAQRWTEGLAGWGLGAPDVAALRDAIAVRVITPGTTAGEPLHVLSSLERRSPLWDEDEEAARESLAASVSLLLRLCERDADARSREHVVLSHLAERRLRAAKPAGLPELLADLQSPPIPTIGALAFDDFLPAKERLSLVQELNTLLASPTFASWRQGAPLDVAEWLRPVGGKTPAVIVSVAHLDDAERQLVLGLLFEELLSWVRGLSGTSELRALVAFDEVFGFLPPHPANPPTKRPLLSLLKQARAFGVGLCLATQNPMDLDYKALSNAGTWFVGRLQTDADRERVVEGLAGSEGGAGGLEAAELADVLRNLPPRAFFVRDVHMTPACQLVETRWCLAWLRGPMTRREISRLVRGRAATAAPGAGESAGATPPTASSLSAAPSASAPTSTSTGPTVVGQGNVTVGVPRAPEGWRTFHGQAPALPTGVWFYTPHLAATVVAHVRDTKRGIAANRTSTFVAPFGPDGKPDLARAVEVDRKNLEAPAPEGARYQPLPEILLKKAGAQAAERAVREHVYRSLEVAVDVQPELGLTRADDEPREAFAARCHAEAARRAAAEAQAIAARHAPKLAKLQNRLVAAQAASAQAEAAAGAAPGEMSAAILGVFAGKRSGQRVLGQHDKALARAGKARAELVESDAALREAIAARDAEIAAAHQAGQRAAAGIEVRRLAPKKQDVEVTEIGVAWSGR